LEQRRKTNAAVTQKKIEPPKAKKQPFDKSTDSGWTIMKAFTFKTIMKKVDKKLSTIKNNMFKSKETKLKANLVKNIELKQEKTTQL
jgi:hypothetical protein